MIDRQDPKVGQKMVEILTPNKVTNRIIGGVYQKDERGLKIERMRDNLAEIQKMMTRHEYTSHMAALFEENQKIVESLHAEPVRD